MKAKPFISAEKFVYSREQVETIYKFLDCNEWNVIKVFDAVWREGVFPDAKWYQAGTVLNLVDQIATLRKLVGRSPERIWKAFTQAAEEHTFDRIVLK